MHPKQVFFILVYEGLERFTYYNIHTILVLYFSDGFKFSEHLATGVFHGMVFVAYILPLIGAGIADSWLGKFNTIFYMAAIYITGTFLLASSSIELEDDSSEVVMCLTGLFLIAIGTGGMKPCVTPFGADQYNKATQEKELNSYFIIFYWFINAGSVFACFFAPFLRSNVKCFGAETCYFLVFGIATVSITSALAVFLSGRKFYIMRPVEQKVVINFIRCVSHGIAMRVKSSEKKQHWLDYADDKFTISFIEDVKTILAVFFVILPTMVFWALNEKQSSRWIFQARQMDGFITKSFKIEPDQMVTISPLLVLLFVPLFEKVLYPCFERIGILKSLFKRMCVGAYLMGVTSIIASVLQYVIKYKKKQKLHIAWQVPQYVILVCAEILFITNGTNFIYVQSPRQMKTLASSLWLLTVSLGNIFALVIAAFGIPDLAIEFLVDAGMMILAATLFIFTSSRYRWRTFSESEIDLASAETLSNLSR